MRDILKKDITLRIVSIFIAFILWLYVVDAQNPETEQTIKDIPIEFTNSDAIEQQGLMIMNHEVEKVTLKIKGRRKTLASLNNENIKAVADLRGLNKTGEYPVMIQVLMPIEGVEIIEKKPYNTLVKLDRIMQVQKEVQVETKGAPRRPYIALEPQVKPNIVTLKAPSSIINAIDRLKVTVDISERTKDIITTQKYEIYNKNNEIINSNNIIKEIDTVEVVYPIRKTKTVPVNPRMIGTPAKDYVITDVKVSPENITIVGKDEAVDNVEQVLTEPIPIDGIQDDMDMQIPLQLEEGIELIGTNNHARVEIDVEKQVTRTIEIDTIRVHNVPEEFSYKMITKKLNIQVKGIESKIKDITKKDIYASVDIGAYKEGQHEVPVSIIVDSGIEVVETYVAVVRLSKQHSEENQRNTNNNNTSVPVSGDLTDLPDNSQLKDPDTSNSTDRKNRTNDQQDKSGMNAEDSI